MPGFLTHYLTGMESCDLLTDNYIQNLIRNNNHAFLIGLQGSELLSFNPHSLSKRGLSYRTASMSLRNQESAALFHNMLDYIQTIQGADRDSCIAYMAGYLCYYALDQIASPYILYKVWQDLPPNTSSRKMTTHKREIETTIDTVLLRSHCHLEPSQLNFEALTFASKKDMISIGHMLRYTIQETYHHKISPSEIAGGLRALRHEYVYLQPDAGIRKVWFTRVQPNIPLTHKKVYEDFLPDNNDYMNTDNRPWYPYPGCPETYRFSFEELFQQSLISCRTLLEDLDSCLSWGMDSEQLITEIMSLNPYSRL